ncbi:hypothetical protein BV22DRAFT_1127474 [Leucogyrophana mollusca]|uniref:Uncharacterized protein n=1 Tax=Leucogyrophana mollusca TaxID=85980 RepID=A0ACB8BPB1_9AGAM|nr:hypothetical protein BV22DRAFT_1127474 [Leucogyrophana mollusca]
MFATSLSLTFASVLKADLIWSRRWSLTTAVYLIARYAGTLSVIQQGMWDSTGHTLSGFRVYFWVALTRLLLRFLVINRRIMYSPTLSDSTYIALNWSINLFIIAMQVILLMRAYALCNQSKKVLTFLVFCFCCQAIAAIVLTGIQYNFPTMRIYVAFLGPAIGSVTQSSEVDPSAFVVAPVIVVVIQLVMDAILFIFALCAFSKHALEARRLDGGWSVSPLMRLLITDQILYFICYVAWQAISVAAEYSSAEVQAPLWVTIADSILNVLVVIIGPRMVLSLRAKEQQTRDGTIETELSTIHFGVWDLPPPPMGEEDIEIAQGGGDLEAASFKRSGRESKVGPGASADVCTI